MNKIARFILLVVKEPRDAGRMLAVLVALVTAAVIMPSHAKK